MQDKITLIVGLGNPGKSYAETRHNVGAWFVEKLADSYQASFSNETKFFASISNASISNNTCRLMLPNTYMNESGKAISSISKFYKIPIEEILVAHDDIDLPPGVCKLKDGGGHGGHNGLRDTISRLSGNDFKRLRIGVGHPGSKHLVHDYVLHKPSVSDLQKITNGIDEAIAITPMLVNGDINAAMKELHTNLEK